MKILLTDSEIVLNLNNTNFVDYWISKQFSNKSQIEVSVQQDQCNDLHMQYVDAWDYFNRVIVNVNNAILALNCEQTLNRPMLFPVANTPSVDYLEKIHEQWAQFTKDSTVSELSSWTQQNLDVYHEINTALRDSKYHYDDVNWAVHRLEFLYKHIFLTDIKTIDNWTFDKSEYTVTAKDTTFDRQNVMIPFYDIGRPQFEKWAICGKVIHEEISNYINISTKLHLLVNRAAITPPMDYVNKCITSGVDVFGPNLSLGNFDVRNVDHAGYDILKHLNKTNKLILEK
jgi:hypothetical protein